MAKTPDAVFGAARAGLGKGAREGGGRRGRTAAAGRRGGQQRQDRRLGLALLPGEAARREIRLRRGRAEALSAARAASSTPASTSRRGCSASRFEEKQGIAAWHPDVRVFEVLQCRRQRVAALFLADYFARPSKRSGAWMSALQSGYRLGDGSTADHLQRHEFRQAAGRRGGAAVARRGEDAVPRIRPRAARHADRGHLAVVSRAPRCRAISSNCRRSSTSTG